MPLATAMPCAKASSKVAPVTTCLIVDPCSSAASSGSVYTGSSSTTSSSASSTISSCGISSCTTVSCIGTSCGISSCTTVSCIGTSCGGISWTSDSSTLSVTGSLTGSSCTSTVSSVPSLYSFSSSTSSSVDSGCFSGSGFFLTAPGRLSYFSCWSGVSGLYFIFSSIARYTYLPSLNHKIRSSHSSRHSAVIPASSYNLASSYAHFSIYSAFLNSSSAVIWSVSDAPCVLRILYFKIYWFGSFGASFTNSS